MTYDEILDKVRNRCIPPGKVKRAVDSKDSGVLSGWRSGVYTYACELVLGLTEGLHVKHSDSATADTLNLRNLLNGAESWEQFSYGGCSLIYDVDIARRLCTAKAFARVRSGASRPNARESWLDVQARALREAARMLLEYV